MRKLALILGFFSILVFSGCSTSNNTLGSTLLPDAQVKNILKTGANSAFSIFGNPNDFLTNALIDAVMPQGLKDINAKLQQLGLTSIIEKEKTIIGDVARKSAVLMKPLITNTIQNITPTDAITILSGGKGAATKYLREKTEAQLIRSLTPVVTSELNKYGATKMINTALGGNNMLDSLVGGLLGNKPNNQTSTGNQLESLVTKQLVNGLYNVMLDSEMKNNLITNGINTILNGGN